MRVTGDEPQGTMGRVQTVVRTFSSRERERERRLGTRQVHLYKTELC